MRSIAKKATENWQIVSCQNDVLDVITADAIRIRKVTVVEIASGFHRLTLDTLQRDTAVDHQFAVTENVADGRSLFTRKLLSGSPGT